MYVKKNLKLFVVNFVNRKILKNQISKPDIELGTKKDYYYNYREETVSYN